MIMVETFESLTAADGAPTLDRKAVPKHDGPSFKWLDVVHVCQVVKALCLWCVGHGCCLCPLSFDMEVD